MRRRSGLAMAVVLMSLSLAVIIVVAIGTLGVQHLNQANAALCSRISLYAAEAGLAQALVELTSNNAWNAGYSNVLFSSENDARYSVQVTNNMDGTAAVTAPDGRSVPADRVWLVATGTCRGGRHPRRVEVMAGAPGEFLYAVASGGNINFKAHTVITGSVKSSGNLTSSASMVVNKVGGRGRVLAGGDIHNGILNVDLTQDVRAGGDVSNPLSIASGVLVEENDDTVATEPFITDGRTTNKAIGGEVMPNPDEDVLLAPGGYVDHGATTSITSDFDLGGKTHYFPNGVTFGNSVKVTGPGTVVVGNGNDAIFDCNLGTGGTPLVMNVVALDGDDGQTGGNRVVFNSATRLEGLIYSHGTIETTASFRLDGVMIAYGNGDLSHTGASATITYAKIKHAIPGFESFFDMGLARPIVSLSWQRC